MLPAVGRADDANIMPEFTQRTDEFFDMNRLAVLGGGAMVVEDFHLGGSMTELLTGRRLPWATMRMVETIIGGIRR